MKNGQLEILWMTGPSAPDTLIECVTCKCKAGCKNLRCSCVKSGLQCTDICGCSDCSNYASEDDGPMKEPDECDDSDYDDADDTHENFINDFNEMFY